MGSGPSASNRLRSQADPDERVLLRVPAVDGPQAAPQTQATPASEAASQGPSPKPSRASAVRRNYGWYRRSLRYTRAPASTSVSNSLSGRPGFRRVHQGRSDPVAADAVYAGDVVDGEGRAGLSRQGRQGVVFGAVEDARPARRRPLHGHDGAGLPRRDPGQDARRCHTWQAH